MNRPSEFRALRRYSRHLLIPEIGLAGQEKLQSARVLCIGVGGLGSAAVAYLAAAGIGCIGLIDDDVIDLTNLQRQILYSDAQIGAPKVAAAAEYIQSHNPHVRVETFQTRLSPENALELIGSYDVILDGSDNFTTRYLVNDACILAGRPNVFASIYRFEAQITFFDAVGGPCYRCLYPQPPPAADRPSCSDGGVLGAVAGIAGTWQATEALKALLRIGESLRGRLLRIDALRARQSELRITADPLCPLCGPAPQITMIDATRYESPPRTPLFEEEILPSAVAAELAAGAKILDVREPHEVVLGFLPQTVHIPYSQLSARLHELAPRQKYIVACRVGAKSALAMTRLQDAGLTRIAHLRAGILGYAAYDAQLDAF